MSEKIGSARKISGIKDWQEFLVRCKEVSSEEEAIGLVYCGTTIPYPDNVFISDGQKIERINFYLDNIKHTNSRIAAFVQQIIIRQWLKILQELPVESSSGCLKTTNRILEFLQNPSDLLLKPPHPRFVSGYLSKLHDNWRNGTRQDEEYLALQGSTELIVGALCVWGLGHVLSQDTMRPEIIPIIKKFLDKRKYPIGKVFVHMSVGDQPADISGGGGEEWVNSSAARAFIKLKYLAGGGFTARFDGGNSQYHLVGDFPKKIPTVLLDPTYWKNLPNSYVCCCMECGKSFPFEMDTTTTQVIFDRINEKYQEHKVVCPGLKWEMFQVFDGEVFNVPKETEKLILVER